MIITPSNQTGFTIIELIMVVCMIALVMAFAGPSLDGYTQEIRTKAVAREIYTNLQLARLTAIKQNKSVNVTFVLNGPAAMAVTYSSDGSNVIPPVNFFQEDPDIVLSITPTQTGQVTYNPTGTLNSVSQVITVISNDPQIVTQYEYDITINASGGLKLDKI
jgi:type IV fimbrial biogenesis protein FimT